LISTRTPSRPGGDKAYKFEAISERGGVLGAMDTMYQRGKIQDESMYYEHKKRDISNGPAWLARG
jgi:hypothetical protein